MNERRDRLQRELEHLTKTFKAGIMTEKEYKKGKDRIEQKLKDIDEQTSRDDKTKEIIKDILDEKEEPSKEDEEEPEEKPYEKVIYSEEIDEEEPPVDEEEKEKKEEKEDREKKEGGKKAEAKKKSSKSTKKKSTKKNVSTAKARTKDRKPSNLATYLIILAIIVVILYSYRDTLGITGAAVKAPTEVIINSSDVVDMDVFMDYSCDHARAMQENLKLLKIAYIDNVNINYRYLPIDEESVRPMIALECAKEQNVFWRYHKLLTYESEDAISEDRLVELFDSISETEPELELDSGSFSECLESEEAKSQIIDDMETASELAIDRTPVLVIDGDIYIGHRTADEMSKILNERLS
jgi:protein-disulfide isomerase